VWQFHLLLVLTGAAVISLLSEMVSAHVQEMKGLLAGSWRRLLSQQMVWEKIPAKWSNICRVHGDKMCDSRLVGTVHSSESFSCWKLALICILMKRTNGIACGKVRRDMASSSSEEDDLVYWSHSSFWWWSESGKCDEDKIQNQNTIS
jgi:hypothetical protein